MALRSYVLRNGCAVLAEYAIEQTLEPLRYRILLFSTNWNINSEKEKIQLAIESQVDGIILKPIYTKAKHFNNLPVPVVLVSQTFNNSISWVDIDNKECLWITATYRLFIEWKYKASKVQKPMSGTFDMPSRQV